LNTDIKSDIDKEVETIDPKLKAKANYYKNTGTTKDMGRLASNAVSGHIIAGAVKG
jgi:hypothetical protein